MYQSYYYIYNLNNEDPYIEEFNAIQVQCDKIEIDGHYTIRFRLYHIQDIPYVEISKEEFDNAYTIVLGEINKLKDYRLKRNLLLEKKKYEDPYDDLPF